MTTPVATTCSTGQRRNPQPAPQQQAPKDDVSLIFSKLSTLPIATQHPELLTKCRPIVQLWHDALSRSDPPLWNRLRRALPKELNESAFIIREMMEFFDDVGEGSEEDSPYTIVDMCSGVGFLSMFLSHLLPPKKVSRIWAVDTLFGLSDKALAGVPTKDVEQGETTSSQGNDTNRPHLSSDHLTSAIAHPIPIRPRKANIKKGRELKQIAKHCIDKAPGPTIILGVHLCKSLSVHTVRLFNTSEKACRLYLKPCCLPGKKELRRREPPFWAFEHMSGGGLGVVTLYCSEVRPSNAAEDEKEGDGGGENFEKDGAIADVARKLKIMGREASKEEGKGDTLEYHNQPSKLKGGQLFKRWTDLLCDAVDASQEGVTAEVHHVSVQRTHFQNDYIVATRTTCM